MVGVASANDKGTVLVTRQYTHNMRKEIPDKPDRYKVNNVVLRPTALGNALGKLMAVVDTANYELPHFALQVLPTGEQDVDVGD